MIRGCYRPTGHDLILGYAVSPPVTPLSALTALQWETRNVKLDRPSTMSADSGGVFEQHLT
jgi:hypothetical protein